MKKIIKQLFKFGIVGIICFLIDYALLYVLTEYVNIHYLVSSIISFSISTIVNYILSIRWVFDVNKESNKKVQFILFWVLSIIGLILNAIIMWIGVEKVHINYLIVKIIATAIVMCFNFITRKIFLERNTKLMKKETIIKIRDLLFPFLILLSISINLKYTNKSLSDNLVVYPWIFYLISYISLKILISKNKEFHKGIMILSSLMSIIYVCCYFFHKYSNLTKMFKTNLQIVKCLIVVIGFTIMTYYLLVYLYEKINNNKFKEKKNKILKFIFKDHPFISSFIIILICYIPIIYIFYPGVLNGDAFDEIRQFNHTYTWSVSYINLIDESVFINSHHSAFHTVILGGLFKLFGSNKFAVFMISSIQVIIQSLVLAYSIRLMNKLNVNYSLRIIVLLFYCLFPMISINSIGIYKDIIFSIIMLLYICFLIEYIYLKEHRLLLIILTSILLVLLSNKGIYVLLATTLYLLFQKRNKKELIFIFIIPIVFYFGYQKLLLPKLKVTPGSIQETLSLPIQQVSSVVVYNEKSLTKKDKQIISSLLEYDKIKERYNSTTVDPIKNHFNKNYTNKQIKDFLKLWVRLFFKNKKVYINSFGSLYCNYLNYSHNNGVVYYVSDESTEDEFKVDGLYNKVKQTHIKTIKKVKEINLFIRKMPIIGMLYNISFYIWSSIILMIYLIKEKKYKELVTFIPVLIIILFCFVSPVNGNKRYIYPIVYSLPMLITYVTVLKYKERN